MKMIMRCTECGTLVHVLNKRWCCGIDWYGMSLSVPKETQVTTVETSTKRRRRKRKLQVQGSLRVSVLTRDGNKCVKCGSKERLQVHHKIHRANGGTNDMSNLETLCVACHRLQHIGENVAKIIK